MPCQAEQAPVRQPKQAALPAQHSEEDNEDEDKGGQAGGKGELNKGGPKQRRRGPALHELLDVVAEQILASLAQREGQHRAGEGSKAHGEAVSKCAPPRKLGIIRTDATSDGCKDRGGSN